MTTATVARAEDRPYGEARDARAVYERMYLPARMASYRCGLDLLGEPDGRLLLDVGCNYGHFLAVAKTRGWAVRGFEPAPAVRRLAVESVRDLIFETLDQAAALARVDVVTLWDALEHTLDPRRELERLAQILKPGGTLLVRVPDARALRPGTWRRTLRPFRAAYLWLAHPTNPEEHPHHFTPTSLSRLAQQVGLVAVHEIDSKPDERVISSKFFGDAIARRALHRAGRDLPYEFTMLLEAPGG